MTGTTATVVCTVLGVAGATVPAALADAPDSPWWFVAIVAPLAVFTAWLVRLIIQRQDAMHRENRARELRREAREEKRAKHAVRQTWAMRQCVSELRRISALLVEQAKAIDSVPARVIELLDERDERKSA